MTVRTRIAPSPTGIAHIGTAYMALFNYAFAKKHGGDFIVRIEDTDRVRFVTGAENVIFESLSWLSIPHAEGPDIGGPYEPYRQSDNLPEYKQAALELIDKGHAYYCFCSSERLETMRQEQQARKVIPHYDGLCRRLTQAESKVRVDAGEAHVIRMKLPENEIISWEDLIRGHVEINTNVMDDQVILKTDGFPTYHLGVVVDDNRMKITHIMRGEEWISSTPKHILLYRYFGWEQPFFAHMPLLRNLDKSKMSKRKNDVSIPSYREKGYLPQALRNYLCLLGWSHPDEKDIFSLEEFIETFSLERMQKTGPIFDVNKLNWMNGKYIREHLSATELEQALQPFLPADFPRDRFSDIFPLVKDRLVTLADIESLTDFFYREVTPPPESLIGKKDTKEHAIEYLKAAAEVLKSDMQWKSEVLETAVRDMCDGRGWNRGSFFMSVRVALTGKTATPPLFDVIEILGKDAVLTRLTKAVNILMS